MTLVQESVVAKLFVAMSRYRIIEQVQRTHLHTEEGARDVDQFSTDDNNLLSRKRLLGDDGGETTEEVSLAVNDDRRRAEGGHGCERRCQRSVARCDGCVEGV